MCRRKGDKVAPELLDKVHVYDVPLKGADGEYIMDNIDGQDMTVWCTQGPIADRTKENLGASDNGIALYRRVLRREIKKVEQGRDPMFTFRDRRQEQRIDLPNERKKHHNSDGMRSWIMRTHAAYSPIAEDVIAMFEGVKPEPRAAWSAGAPRPSFACSLRSRLRHDGLSSGPSRE